MAKLKTGRHTSALKEARKAVKRNESNTSVRTRIRTLVRTIETSVAKKDAEGARKLMRTAFAEWDKAARRNIVHANAAAHQKARISRLIASLGA